MIRQGRLPLWNDLAGCGAPHLANGQSAVFDPFHAIAYLGTLPGRPRLDGRRAALGRRAGDVPAGAALGLGRLGTLVRGPGVPVLRLPGRLAPLPGHERGGLDALAVLGERPGARTARAADGRGAGSGRRPGLAGGHVQTSAHVLLAAAAYVAWRACRGGLPASHAPGLGGVERRHSAGHCGGERRGDPAGGSTWRGARSGAIAAERPSTALGAGAAAPARRRLHGAALCVREPAAGASQPGAGCRGPQPERVGGGIRRPGHAALARASGLPRRGGGSRGSRSSPDWRLFGRDGGVRVPSRRQPAPGACRSWT